VLFQQFPTYIIYGAGETHNYGTPGPTLRLFIISRCCSYYFFSTCICIFCNFKHLFTTGCTLFFII